MLRTAPVARRTAALALLAAALCAAPTAARADDLGPLTVSVTPGTTTAGETATVSGAAAPGTTVSLFGYSSPSTTYALQRQGTAAPDGTYAFVVSPATSSRYYVADDAGSTSSSVALVVRTAVELDPVTTEGDQVTVSGRLLPRGGQTAVQVVVSRGGERTVVATAPAGPRTGFRTTFTSGLRGAFWVSVAVPATRDNAAGESAVQRVVVTPGPAGDRTSAP